MSGLEGRIKDLEARHVDDQAKLRDMEKYKVHGSMAWHVLMSCDGSDGLGVAYRTCTSHPSRIGSAGVTAGVQVKVAHVPG